MKCMWVPSLVMGEGEKIGTFMLHNSADREDATHVLGGRCLPCSFDTDRLWDPEYLSASGQLW